MKRMREQRKIFDEGGKRKRINCDKENKGENKTTMGQGESQTK
jgi:hypothetical protein